jgi:hypothetical protein
MRRARRIHLARHAVPPPSRCEPATAVARVAPTIPRPYGMGLRTHDERLAEMKGPPLLRPPGQVQPTLAVDPLQSLMTPPRARRAAADRAPRPAAPAPVGSHQRRASGPSPGASRRAQSTRGRSSVARLTPPRGRPAERAGTFTRIRCVTTSRPPAGHSAVLRGHP